MCLVVDDNQVNRDIVSRHLFHFKITHDLAASGQEAVELAKLHRYQFILMDISMPDMDGFESTSLIRQDGLSKDSPIIAHTTLNYEPTFFETKGLNDYLSKPFKREALQQIVGKYSKN